MTFTEPARTGRKTRISASALVTQFWYPRAREPAGPFPLLFLHVAVMVFPYSALRESGGP